MCYIIPQKFDCEQVQFESMPTLQTVKTRRFGKMRQLSSSTLPHNVLFNRLLFKKWHFDFVINIGLVKKTTN